MTTFPKIRKFSICTVGGLVLLIVAIQIIDNARQPRFAGKRASHWMRELNRGPWPPSARVKDAFRGMGEESVPFLVAEFGAEMNTPKSEYRYQRWHAKMPGPIQTMMPAPSWLPVRRIRALDTLADLGPAASSATPDVIRMLELARPSRGSTTFYSGPIITNSVPEALRRQAAETLLAIAEDDPEAMLGLLKSISHPYADLGVSLNQRIIDRIDYNDRRQVIQLMIAFGNNSRQEIAIPMLRVLQRALPRYVDLLPAIANGTLKNKAVAMESAIALRDATIYEGHEYFGWALTRLVEKADTSGYAIRRACVETLGELAVDTEETRSALERARSSTSPSVRAAAVTALAKLSGDSNARR
jgi:hypothetical protein